METEIATVIELFDDHIERLRLNLKCKKMRPSKSSKQMSASFKAALEKNTAVKLTDDEFLISVDYALWKKINKKTGRKSFFTACVAESVQHIVKLLHKTGDYIPIFLTDEVMGIDKYVAVAGDDMLKATERRCYRMLFRDEMQAIIHRTCVNIYGKLNSGQTADCIFVCKVPAIN